MRRARRRQGPEKRAFLAEFGAGGRGEIAITVRGWRMEILDWNWMDDSEWAIDAPSRRQAAQLVPADDTQVARTWRCCSPHTSSANFHSSLALDAINAKKHEMDFLLCVDVERECRKSS